MDKDNLYLEHIVQAVGKIKTYTEGLTLEAFKADSLRQDGVVRELEIIGEAARMISEKTKAAHPDIPWYQIIGMRNRLIHEYFGVDIDAVWKTAAQDLQVLVDAFSEKAESEATGG
jgi:uncharacterized protein with HEPN domain